MANLVCFLLLLLVPAIVIAESHEGIDGPFLDESEISWKVNEFRVARWKTLVGGIEGGQVNRDDIQFGTWELAPGAIYHSHRHDAPEIYYITAGRANWTVGGETREVGPGMTIYTKPGAEHRMENLSDEPVKALWVWWAPNGDKEVFMGNYEFTEPAPQENGSFSDNPGERIH